MSMNAWYPLDERLIKEIDVIIEKLQEMKRGDKARLLSLSIEHNREDIFSAVTKTIKINYIEKKGNNNMNNNNKVVLPKEVFDAIQSMSRNVSKDAFFDVLWLEQRVNSNDNAKILVEFFKKSATNRELYFKALVNGYECEALKTPLEIIEQYMNGKHRAFWDALGGSDEEKKALNQRDAASEIRELLKNHPAANKSE